MVPMLDSTSKCLTHVGPCLSKLACLLFSLANFDDQINFMANFRTRSGENDALILEMKDEICTHNTSFCTNWSPNRMIVVTYLGMKPDYSKIDTVCLFVYFNFTELCF